MTVDMGVGTSTGAVRFSMRPPCRRVTVGLHRNGVFDIIQVKKLTSMTEEFHSYGNAMAGRLNGILKHGCFLDGRFKAESEARKAVAETIHVDDVRRLLGKCGFKIPGSFREESMRTAA